MNRLLASCAIAALSVYALPLNAAEPIGGKAMLPSASNATLPNARDNLGVAATVPTHAALVAATIAKYPNGVWRADYAVGNGVPALFFLPQTGTCVSHGMTDDIGYCVDAAEGNSFVAQYPNNIVDPQQFDPLCGGQTTLDEFKAGTAHDCAPALQAAVSVVIDGVRADVRLSSGYYYVKDGVTLGLGQTLYSAGHHSATLLVDSLFSPTAEGVVILTDREEQSPTVRDLGITFAQPQDQGSRANFLTLAQGCTSAAGGSGCKYPPAVYVKTANRFKIKDIRVASAWDGIVSPASNSIGGFFLDNIEMGALNTGLELNNGLDFGHIKSYHFWSFGIPGTQPIYNVYIDGNNYAAKFASVNGFLIEDFSDWRGRISIDGFTWGQIVNLDLDGHNAALEMEGNVLPGVQISNIYSTGIANGSYSGCKVDIKSGNTLTTISNPSLIDGGGGNNVSTLCVAGGATIVSGGQIDSSTPSHTAVTQTGGALTIKGTRLGVNTAAGAWTVPMINQTGGDIMLTGNNMGAQSPMGSVPVFALTDTIGNYVSGNAMNGWKPVDPSLGAIGYYEFADSPFPLTISPHFATDGDFAPVNLFTGGSYFRMGNWVDFEFIAQWDNNSYTTASGTWRIDTNMPGRIGSGQGCTVNVFAGVVVSHTPVCYYTTVGGKLSMGLTIGLSGEVMQNLGTPNFPSGADGFVIETTGRYRIR